MGPNYSDVDEVTGTLQTFQHLSDVETSSEEILPLQRNRAKYGRKQERRLDTSTPVQQHAIALPTRQRKISDVSDTTQSDGEDGDARASFNTSLSSIPSKASEMGVCGRGRSRTATRRPYGRTTDSSLSSSGVSDVDELVGQRRRAVDNQSSEIYRNSSRGEGKRLSIDTPPVSPSTSLPAFCRRVNKKWTHEADKRSKSQLNDPTTTNNNNSCNRDCRQCKRRQTRLIQQSSEVSTDLGISTSDIDDDTWKLTENTASEMAKTDSEIDEADEDTMTRKLMKTKSRFQGSTLYSRVEAHHCKMCCDIDAQTSECEFCGLALCNSCYRIHFSMHAADVKDRLERLRKLTVASSQKEARHRLMTEIDKTVLDLTIACNTAMDRAVDVYRATASISTSFIGSLVDRRIKLSNSLKYLLRQIPRILTSDDVYELMYFIKVARSVHERMEELQLAIGDPRSKEVFKLVLTNAFSSFGPLFEQNSLLLPLDSCDQPQGHADAQSKSSGLQKVNKNVGVSFLELQSAVEKM